MKEKNWMILEGSRERNKVNVVDKMCDEKMLDLQHDNDTTCVQDEMEPNMEVT